LFSQLNNCWEFGFEKLDDEHIYHFFFLMVGQKKIMFGGEKWVIKKQSFCIALYGVFFNEQ
jgi:hypothetical protein